MFLLTKGRSDNSNMPNSELLPFVQNLCSQVNHLCMGHSTKWPENIFKSGKGNVGVMCVFYFKTNVV
jgi:hypothetical protein